jgi:phage repressor protein C with HTH and peptisase S24 domain
MAFEKVIPIAKAEDLDPMASACEAKEPFVLMVLGDSMAPEFMEGDVIVIDPEGIARDGAYVLAYHREEYIFRQLSVVDGQWFLVALNPADSKEPIPGPEAVRGVIVQKKTPGKRGSSKKY